MSIGKATSIEAFATKYLGYLFGMEGRASTRCTVVVLYVAIYSHCKCIDKLSYASFDISCILLTETVMHKFSFFTQVVSAKISSEL